MLIAKFGTLNRRKCVFVQTKGLQTSVRGQHKLLHISSTARYLT